MIVIVSTRESIIVDLSNELAKHKARVEVLNPNATHIVAQLYRPFVSAVILDQRIPGMPRGALTDLLNGLSHRLPVIIVSDEAEHSNLADAKEERSQFSDMVTVLTEAKAASIVATLHSCGVLGTASPKIGKRTVAYYSPHVATKMLIENGSISVLTIDASSFRKIEVEYGSEVYGKVKDLFQNILSEMWGRPGCFRASDVLCRRSNHGNLYYVFLNRSRTTGSLPLPGVLEDISDRLARIIQNAIWEELSSPQKKRRLPTCIHSMPKVVVGYGSAVYNPCLDPHEIVASAIDSSAKFASMQSIRNLERHREMMTTLIQSTELLYPNFQAVFRLGHITKDMVEKAQAEKSFSVLEPYLYAFESLIRVRVEEVRALIGSARAVIDPSFLRPDILFETAKLTKVALELDQACLNLAVNYGKNLPGYLMVNILPRNLYFMKHLKDLFKVRSNIILEVSESENINNHDLIDDIRKQVADKNILFAADDFGRAFAGLDRIILMKPQLIKFDRSLIEDIHEDPVKHAYVSGLVEAARMLKTEVLAEGVEKWEELDVLQQMGIHYVQGFLVHRPQDLETVMKQLSDLTLKQKLDTVA